MLTLVNFLLFQAGWFVCVLLGSFWAVIFTAFALVVHCCCVVRLSGKSVNNELLWVFSVLCVGLLLESLYFGLGILIREDGVEFPPAWLLCLWVLFSTTVRYSLAWLRQRLILAVSCVAISAPSSYYAGALMSDTVDMAQPVGFALFLIGITWVVAFSLMLFFSPIKIHRV
jgi:hypothetical protein